MLSGNYPPQKCPPIFYHYLTWNICCIPYRATPKLYSTARFIKIKYRKQDVYLKYRSRSRGLITTDENSVLPLCGPLQPRGKYCCVQNSTFLPVLSWPFVTKYWAVNTRRWKSFLYDQLECVKQKILFLFNCIQEI